MKLNDTLVRDSDGKRFKVVEPGHWSKIKADDGEIDSVKWYGGNEAELYVGQINGEGYELENA